MNENFSPQNLDPYAVLGVDTDASPTAIRAAYRRAALATHPDRVPAAEKEQATVRFAQISNAYEILSNEERRQEYDAAQQMSAPASFASDFGRPSDFGFHDPFQVFESVFAQEFGRNNSYDNYDGNRRRSSRSMRHPMDAFFGSDPFLNDPFFGRGRRSIFDNVDDDDDMFFGGSLFGGSPFSSGRRSTSGRRPTDPFDDMFASMRDMQQMQQQIMQQQQQQQQSSGNGGPRQQSSYYYSSSSTTRGGNGESVTTQTTRRLVNGQEECVTERIVRKADGSVERQVLNNNNNNNNPALPPSSETTTTTTNNPSRWLPWRRDSSNHRRER